MKNLPFLFFFSLNSLNKIYFFPFLAISRSFWERERWISLFSLFVNKGEDDSLEKEILAFFTFFLFFVFLFSSTRSKKTTPLSSSSCDIDPTHVSTRAQASCCFALFGMRRHG